MKPEFLDPLDVRQIGWAGGRPLWITLAPLRYVSAVAKDVIVVPADFISDLASVPRLLLSWWVAGGRAPRPAVVHDWLYQHPAWEDRGLADKVLLEAMAADPHSGTNAATRAAMYAAVRAGGWFTWNDHRERAEELNPEWSASRWPDSHTGGVEAP